MPKEKIPVLNPLTEDFTFKYDVNNNRNPVSFTIHAGEAEWYEPYLAKHAKKQLANLIFDKQGNPRKDREMQIKEIMKDISIKYES